MNWRTRWSHPLFRKNPARLRVYAGEIETTNENQDKFLSKKATKTKILLYNESIKLYA